MNKFKLLLLTFLICFGFTTWAQTIEVSGVVYDESNSPLPGANILVKGISNGASTDFDGNFTINLEAGNQTLVVSYLGYITQEVTVGSKKYFKIKLELDATGLDEVVVIGYGAVKKSDATGSVVSLDAGKLTEMRKTDVAEAMQGRMAGVDVRRVNSKPGSPLSIKIRGNTVVKNTNVTKDGVSDDLDSDLSKPLYVVDGIFMDDLSMINPSDIEKLDVLKDASATAIYGSRGANGVVIITLKAGKAGKMQISYDGSVGVDNVVNEPDMYGGDKYVAYVSDHLKGEQWVGQWTDGSASVEDYNNTDISGELNGEFIGDNEQSNVANKNYTNWRKLLRKKNQLQTSHTVSIFGGKEGVIYNASVGMTKNDGLMGVEGYDRYNLSASVTNQFNEKLKGGVKTYFSTSEQEGGSKELFRSSMRLAPTVNAYNDDGSYILLPDLQDSRFINPLYEVEGSWLTNTVRNSFIANIFLEYKPTDWVKLKTNFAPEISNSRYGEYRGLLTKSARNDQSRTRAYYNTAFKRRYTWDNTADFDFKINDDHQFKATLITALTLEQDEGSNIESRNVSSDSFDFYNTGAGSDVKSYDSYYSKETLSSFAGRVNYNLKDKYLLTFTGRYDGSSKLAEGHKWAFFPSAALAWKVSEEKFLTNVDWLSNLKFRVSYGESGNDAPVSRYASQAYLNSTDYLFGDSYSLGQVINSLVNTELGWERSKEFNIGLNTSLFKGRVRFEIEYYNKKTVDAILDRDLMGLTSFQGSTGNYGSVRNKGVEIALTTINVKTENFKWTTNLNFSKNTNELIALYGDVEELPYGTHGVLKVGSSIDAVYSYNKLGIWQMDEAVEAAVYDAVPGMYKFEDQNNDGVINSDDKTVIGSNSPEWIGGMTNYFNYKNFDFNIMMYTRQGVFGHSEFYQNFAPQSGEPKFNKVDLDYWTPNNQEGKYAMPGAALSNGQASDWYFEDMSFVKIGNIGVGYNFSEKQLAKGSFSSLRLSLDFKNPFTFTDYKGPDPETGLQNSYGMAYSSSSVLFGVKLNFK